MNKISHLLSSNKSIIMGILNVTPDSFFDGGKFDSIDNALKQANLMIAEGVDIIDVGGESTRPGAKDVSLEDELQRVIPVIKAIRLNSDICISIDTSKPEVMKEAVKAGANLVNDVNGLRAQDAMTVCAELKVPVCIMHMQGKPRTMQKNPQYKNVADDIVVFLKQQIQLCLKAGIDYENIIIDPGFGFGKNLQQNCQLLKELNKVAQLNVPILVGISRKSMLGAILNNTATDQRLYASVAAAVVARMNGAQIFRVHDIKPTVDALKVCDAINAV